MKLDEGNSAFQFLINQIIIRYYIFVIFIPLYELSSFTENYLYVYLTNQQKFITYN